MEVDRNAPNGTAGRARKGLWPEVAREALDEECRSSGVYAPRVEDRLVKCVHAGGLPEALNGLASNRGRQRRAKRSPLHAGLDGLEDGRGQVVHAPGIEVTRETQESLFVHALRRVSCMD